MWHQHARCQRSWCVVNIRTVLGADLNDSRAYYYQGVTADARERSNQSDLDQVDLDQVDPVQEGQDREGREDLAYQRRCPSVKGWELLSGYAAVRLPALLTRGRDGNWG